MVKCKEKTPVRKMYFFSVERVNNTWDYGSAYKKTLRYDP